MGRVWGISVIKRVQHKERYSESHLSAAVGTEARGSTRGPCTPVHARAPGGKKLWAAHKENSII